MKPDCIIIHHSLTEDNKTVSWGAIRDYHINVKKWNDIGYNWGIELIGERYEILKGRMDNEEGAHCIGFNDHSIGICLVGNFDFIEPNSTQMSVLRKLVLSLMEIHNIPKMNVFGHWETYGLRNRPPEKSCPGNAFSMFSFRHTL